MTVRELKKALENVPDGYKLIISLEDVEVEGIKIDDDARVVDIGY
jgi:hypothetical protein